MLLLFPSLNRQTIQLMEERGKHAGVQVNLQVHDAMGVRTLSVRPKFGRHLPSSDSLCISLTHVQPLEGERLHHVRIHSTAYDDQGCSLSSALAVVACVAARYQDPPTPATLGFR